jgi:phosphohistidine phosphatase SixA
MKRSHLAGLLVPFLCLWFLRAPLAQDPTAPVAPVTVLLLRHGETVEGHAADRELSGLGRARAEALAHLLAASAPTHLFSSDYPRTRQTLEPLARTSGLEVRVISALDSAAQVAAIRELPPGSVAVVAGHSNTVPSMIAELGGEVRDLVDSPYGPVLADGAHDQLFVLSLPRDPGVAVSTLELRYGAGVQERDR